MVHEPGVVVVAEHGDMAVDIPLVLVNNVSGDFRGLVVQLLVQSLEPLLLFHDMDILVRINKSGLKKEVPEGVQVHVGRADEGMAVFCLVQKGGKTDVKAAVFGNVGTMQSFKVGAPDAEFLEKEYTPLLSA